METEDLNYQSNEELFENLKDRCKSRAKAAANTPFIIVLILLLVIMLLFYGTGLKDYADTSFSVFWLLFFGIAVFIHLYNYRFTKKIDNLNTPDQLLKSFKKNLRVELICAWGLWLYLIIDTFTRGSLFTIIEVVLSLAVVLFLFIKGYGPWHRRDKEIIEDLQQLVENK